jgi:hypothetical protein
MALQIRRGLEADLPVSPADGELLYATDTNKLYVGDSGVAQEISGGGGLANVVEDTSPQLGGALDINGFKIVSSSNGNIEIDPNGTGNVILHGNLTIDTNGNITKTGSLNITPTTFTSFGNNSTLADGNVYITRNGYSSTVGSGFTFAQHHETVDAVNFTFFRTRGTGLIPTAVVNGDDVADLAFTAHNGTATVSTGAISAVVDGVPAAGQVPMKFQFLTNNGTATAARAELSAAGIWKVNSIQNFSGSSLTLTATDIIMAGNATINAQGDLRFADADSSNWVAFQAPATVTDNVTWTLPAVDGTTGQVLSTNGGGALSWVTAGAGGSLPSRTTGVGSTGTIANAATANVTITGFKSYMLTKIETTHASWIRIYTDTASRLADASRLEGTDPLPGSGVIAEIIATGSGTFLISPGTLGFNNESVPTTAIELAVTNKSGASTDISITLALLQLEA